MTMDIKQKHIRDLECATRDLTMMRLNIYSAGRRLMINRQSGFIKILMVYFYNFPSPEFQVVRLLALMLQLDHDPGHNLTR